MGLVKIDLPWFPDGINAHNTGGWRGKSEKVKGMRSTAMLLAKMEMRKQGRLVGAVWVEYEFHTNSKLRDEANTIQCCKPYIDGLVDAGIIEGDRFNQLRTWGANFVVVPKGGEQKVILRLMSYEKAIRCRLEEFAD